MKKTIKIKFIDFWQEFDYHKFYLYEVLKEKYNVIIDDNPDYLICSCFGHEHIKYNCIKILYIGENYRPDFNLYDYAIGFDYMTNLDRYIRFPNYLMELDRLEICKKIKNRKYTKKNKFCSFVVSNDKAAERINFFKKLSKYKKVDSGGKALNNIGCEVIDKHLFLKNYKFNIAFENSEYPGYTTEKIIDAFAANTIPIYFGDPNILTVFNEDTFINIKDNNDFDKIIELIKKLDNDEKLYKKYFEKTPFKDKNYIEHEQEKFKIFIYNIFEQNYDKASRIISSEYQKEDIKKEKWLNYYNKIYNIFK